MGVVFFYCVIACQSVTQRGPCDCDILEDMEKYFITSGERIETNANESSLKKGKHVKIDALLDMDPTKLKNKLGLLNGKIQIEVPLMDFDKYAYTYQVEMDHVEDKNMLYYFLSYCSLYPSYHLNAEGCRPATGWKTHVESLRKEYLSPDSTPPNNLSELVSKASEEKRKVHISGRIIHFSDYDKGVPNARIYIKSEEIGRSDENGGFEVELLIAESERVTLNIKAENCSSGTYNIPSNESNIANQPIILKCQE